MSKTILALLGLIALALAACPANYNINGLVAGSLSLTSDSALFNVAQNASTASQTFAYTFTAPFSSAPSVALGTIWFIQPFRTSPSTILTRTHLVLYQLASKKIRWTLSSILLHLFGLNSESTFGPQLTPNCNSDSSASVLHLSLSKRSSESKLRLRLRLTRITLRLKSQSRYPSLSQRIRHREQRSANLNLSNQFVGYQNHSQNHSRNNHQSQKRMVQLSRIFTKHCFIRLIWRIHFTTKLFGICFNWHQ